MSTTSTRITEVVIYRNGALVHRTGRAPAGLVEIDSLPLLFVADTLSVVPTSGSVRDLVDTCRLTTTRTVDGAHDEALDAARAKVASLERKLARIAMRRRSVDMLAPQNAGGKQGLSDPPDPQALLALHQAASERQIALDEATAETRRAANLARREVSRLEHLAENSHASPRFLRGVRFTLDGEGQVDFTVSYFVSAARWVPTYRLDLNRKQSGSAARLRLDAIVAQGSGEDWSGARIRLSTVDLSWSSTLPTMRSWRIGTRQRPMPPAFRPLPAGLDMLFDAYDQAAPPKPVVETTTVYPVRLPSAPPPLPQRSTRGGIDLEEATDSFDLDDDTMAFGAATRPVPAPSRAVAAPAPTRRRAAQPKKAKRRAPASSFEDAEQQASDGVGVAPPSQQLPERFRHAYLRMAGPDEPKRGQLVAVNPLTHLWSLVEDSDEGNLDMLRYAVDGLKQAMYRINALSLPSGTSPVDAFNHVFDADGLHDIPDDGAWHRISVQTFQSDAQTEFRAVPRHDRQIYRFCTIDNPSGVPLPTGPLQVYIDDDFRTTAHLDGTGSSELSLNLGVESGVRVVERTTRIEQSDKGMIGQTTRVDHDVTLRIRSALTEPIEVVVYDRLPRARQETRDLEVELLKSQPTPVMNDLDPNQQKLPGGLHWRVTVQPGQVSTITYSYRLAFPAKYEIDGGNRRE